MRRRRRTREDLLAAARRVLADRGLHQTKIADIAAAADVGVGTFYLHFPTKEALFNAVVEEMVGRLKATVDAVHRGGGDPVARTRATHLAFFRFVADNREVFRVVFGHAATYNDVVRRAQASFAADIATTVREGVASGAFRPVDPEIAAQAMVGMATQVLSWWAEHPDVPLEMLHDQTAALTLHGLCAAPEEEDPHA
ncbi:MAG: TetR/AcrR family transcriptional regulator [Candidatus Binatia bacterium]